MFENITKTYSYKNINRIHPLAQRKVGQIIDVAKTNKDIKNIIVFGSSLTTKCRPESDVDIAIVWKCKSYDEYDDVSPTTAEIHRAMRRTKPHRNLDIIDYDNPSWKELISEIDKKGVKVYG